MTEIVQITKLRSNGDFSAKVVCPDGRLADDAVALRLPDTFRNSVQNAAVLEVTGPRESRHFTVQGHTHHEDVIRVQKARFIHLSTRLIEAWLEANIGGVGRVKASRIARHPELQSLIEAKDLSGLAAVCGNETIAGQVIARFPSGALLDALNWLAARELPPRIALRLFNIWGDCTLERMQADPFVLMEFDVPFDRCAAIAADLGFGSDHDLYRAALARHLVDGFCRRSGSTAMPLEAFEAHAARRGAEAPRGLLRAAGDRSQLTLVKGALQGRGPFLLETEIAHRLLVALDRPNGAGSLLAHWEKDIDQDTITAALAAFERGLPFGLTDDQRAAIIGPVRSKVACLSGGAGTGKTTILKAILAVLGAVSLVETRLLALSGRAAQRMAESTGRPASTIAKFLQDQKREKQPLEHLVVVIDEASMVDVYTFHKLLAALPEATRFIFVGDDHQLPPVGGGLLFHVLMTIKQIPGFKLKSVQRQAEDSGIHQLATAIRTGDASVSIPSYLDDPDADCSFLETDDPEAIRDLYYDSGGPGQAIVLCPTQQGVTGVRAINNEIQKFNGCERPAVRYLDPNRGLITYVNAQGNRFHYGDEILITKNSYDVDVRNGDLGFISEVFDEPQAPLDGEGALAFGLLNVNGKQLRITDDLLDKMALGHAVTIHKAQGSQWPAAILALGRAGSRMLDLTLLYTAVTRPSQKLVIAAPSWDLVESGISRGSVALNRVTNLRHHLLAASGEDRLG